MNIKFNKLHLTNFLSFADAEINLDDNGYTLVTGVNENPDDNAISNGSGKSSIWEAISWCLTGETIRGTRDVVRLGCNDTCTVTLEFKADNKNYKVIRTKDPSNLYVYVNGVDKSGKGIRDTSKLLTQYLPDLTSSLIGSVIILGQGLPQRFTNNNPSGRKEVLETLSQSDFMIYDLKTRIQTRKEVLDKQLREIQDKEVSLNSIIQILEKNLEEIKNQINDLQETDYDNVFTELENEKKKYEEIINNLKNEIESNSNNLNSLQKELAKLNNSYQNAYNKIKDEYNENILILNTNVTSTNSEIKTLKKEINELESISDICPTCGQKLPDVHKIDTTERHNKLDELLEIYKEQKEKLDNKKEELENKLNECTNSFNNNIKEIKENINNISTNIENTKIELNKNENTLSTINSNILTYKVKYENYKNNYQSLIDSIEGKEKEIKENKENLLYYNNEENIINSHLEVINKMNSVTSREFRGYLLNNIISFINDKAKEYSLEVFDTNKISFTQDANNISISYDGKEYECLSGGEKQKIDLIVQLAIRDMLCKFLNFSSNIIVLDELFDNLDSIGCQKVLDLISKKLNDVESIYIVTHHSDISIPADKEIRIIKGKDKVSKIDL